MRVNYAQNSQQENLLGLQSYASARDPFHLPRLTEILAKFFDGDVALQLRLNWESVAI